MAGILVFVEQRGGEVRKASLQALSEAKRQGGAVSAVLPGSGVGDAGPGLGAWGADKIFVADDANLALYSAEGYAEAVVKAVEQVQPSAAADTAPHIAAAQSRLVTERGDLGACAPAPRHAMMDRMDRFLPLRVAVLTVSDSRKVETDTSGALLVERLSGAGHRIVAREMTTDDEHAITEVLGNVSFVAPNHTPGRLVVGTHHVSQDFWVQLFRQLRRSHNVTEHDRELSSFCP